MRAEGVEALCGSALRLSTLCGCTCAQSADLGTQVTALLLQSMHDDLADEGYVEQHSSMQAIIEVRSRSVRLERLRVHEHS